MCRCQERSLSDSSISMTGADGLAFCFSFLSYGTGVRSLLLVGSPSSEYTAVLLLILGFVIGSA
ncbi:hypothetical protein FPQ18DRAFT_8094 [Pyronema domesticum]|nr:hypothetical protein FPQ18DRAFT_8094 [Pyronema domesticum]